MKRKLRMGMVGGGRGAFIGRIHRMAATLDGHIELVCGAFSGNPETSKASGKDYPSIEDGVRGMAFIEVALLFSKNNTAWTGLDL